MEVKIEFETDDPAWDQNMPEGFEVVSYNIVGVGFDLAIVGCLVVRLLKYGGTAVSALTGAKKIYDYFRGKNVKSVKINDQPVDLNDVKAIEKALEGNEV